MQFANNNNNNNLNFVQQNQGYAINIYKNYINLLQVKIIIENF